MRIVVFVIFTLCTGITSSLAFADNVTKLNSHLSKCMKISNDEDRLKCFDKLNNKTLVPLKPSKATSSVVKPQKQDAKLEGANTIDDFSKEDLKKPSEEKGPESITATISKLKKLIRGQWVIYFENGQKWQQKDTANIKIKVGDSVRLKKGSMGAVYLFKEGSKRNIRVKRLK